MGGVTLIETTDLPMGEKEIVSIAEAARRLGVSRSTVYSGVKTGEIPAVKIGKRRIISRVAFERLMHHGSAIFQAGGIVVDYQKLARELRRQELKARLTSAQSELSKLESPFCSQEVGGNR